MVTQAGRRRVRAAALVALGGMAASLAAVVPASATTSVTAQRLSGDTRYATAAAVATTSNFTGAKTAILATGANYPDALAASALAGASAPTPVVLTESDTLSSAASGALTTLKSSGLTSVVVVGGTSAVSDAVVSAVQGLGLTVTRVAGADRYATAAAIAQSAATKVAVGTVSTKPTAVIATGENYPDALAGGAMSYASKLPLLLVSSAGVPSSTQSALTALGIKQVIILGGTSAVSSATQSALETITGNTAIRLSGADRYATAAAIGDFEISTLGFPATSAVLATGTNFPDALAAGPLAGQAKAPVVLTASLPSASQTFLTNHGSTIANLLVVGGTSAVSDDTVSSAQSAAQASSSAVAGNTARPELVSATVVKTVGTSDATTGNPAGTTVQFVFDEAITGATPSPSAFKLYRYADGTSVAGTSASVDATNTSAADVLFSTLTSTDGSSSGTGGLTVAAVALAAVTDVSNLHNPEGAVALSNTPTSSATGMTTAPDLVSVGRYGLSSNPNVAAVDFMFDQAATVRSGGFHLVLVDGTLVNCTAPVSTDTTAGGGSVAGGNGTPVITALCGPVSNGPPTSSSQTGTSGGSTYAGQAPNAGMVARGYVDAGAVSTTTSATLTNPLESTSAQNSPAASSPTLLSASFFVGSTADTIVYTFDQPVLAPTDASKFHVILANGTERSGNTGTQKRSPVNTSVVSVDYASGTLAGAGGASVVFGAVQGATGASVANQPGSVVVSGSGGTSTATAGRTAGPDLLTASLQRINDVFGNLSSANVLYTFDAAISSSVSASNLTAYLVDGTRMQCTTVTTSATSTAVSATQALCTAFTFSPGESGTNSGTPTAAQVMAAVRAGVAAAAVTGSATSISNPEGSAALSS